MPTAIQVAKAVASARLGGALDKAYFAMGFVRGKNLLFEDGYGDIDVILRMLKHIEGAPSAWLFELHPKTLPWQPHHLVLCAPVDSKLMVYVVLEMRRRAGKCVAGRC